MSKLGTFKTPSDPVQLLTKFAGQVFSRLKRYIDRYVEWKSIGPSFKIPTGISTGPKCFDLAYPTGINTTRRRDFKKFGLTLTVPTGSFKMSYKKCFIRPHGIPTGVSSKTIQFYYPKLKRDNPFSRACRI